MIRASALVLLLLQLQGCLCFAPAGRVPQQHVHIAHSPLRSGACYALCGPPAAHVIRRSASDVGVPTGTRASAVSMGSVLGGLKLDTPPDINTGDTVRVTATTSFRHLPKKVAGDSGRFDAKGLVGVVAKAYDEPNLSPNRPIKVRSVRSSPCVTAMIIKHQTTARVVACPDRYRLPPQVAFTEPIKWFGHFDADELEVIEG